MSNPKPNLIPPTPKTPTPIIDQTMTGYSEALSTLVSVSIGLGAQIQAKADPATIDSLKTQVEDRGNAILHMLMDDILYLGAGRIADDDNGEARH